MKKTLFVALMAACAAVAQAAEAQSTIDSSTVPVYTAGDVSTGIILETTFDSDKTFTAAFTLAPTALAAVFAGDTAQSLFTLATKTNDAGSAGMNWTVTATTTGLTLQTNSFGTTSGSVFNVSTDGAAEVGNYNLSTGMDSVDWSNVTAAGLSVAYYGSGTQLFLSLVNEDGSTVTYGGANTSYKTGTTTAPHTLTVNSDLVLAAYVFDNTQQSNYLDRIALATQAATAVAVPEPATATLSLLALAGLAARRRRK